MASGEKENRDNITYAALLRGINVGGRTVPMADLTEIFADSGCSGIRTYIQSGNVVFQTGKAEAGRVAEEVSRSLMERFGFDVPVIIRTATELKEISLNNPFLSEDTDPKTCHVTFLAQKPEPDRLTALNPDRSLPDRFAVKGHEIYLHCPNGYGRTKLTNRYFESTLKTDCTVRNWRTLLKLIEMTGG
jgi:uncharacterized protein (DUF1697 family)